MVTLVVCPGYGGDCERSRHRQVKVVTMVLCTRCDAPSAVNRWSFILLVVCLVDRCCCLVLLLFSVCCACSVRCVAVAVALEARGCSKCSELPLRSIVAVHCVRWFYAMDRFDLLVGVVWCALHSIVSNVLAMVIVGRW